jgi:Deoxyribonuclease NucA/NucB
VRPSITLVVLAAAVALVAAGPSIAHAAPTCADYANQAQAQRAADTRDPDGDGLYCESLPCPCSGTASVPATCLLPAGVQRIVFSARRYPNVRRHFRAALRRGEPRRLVLNRSGAGARRDRLLRGYATREGFDRDEYPPALGRGSWRADVRYVPSSENRSHGAVMGNALSRYCDGTRFRYVFR